MYTLSHQPASLLCWVFTCFTIFTRFKTYYFSFKVVVWIFVLLLISLCFSANKFKLIFFWKARPAWRISFLFPDHLYRVFEGFLTLKYGFLKLKSMSRLFNVLIVIKTLQLECRFLLLSFDFKREKYLHKDWLQHECKIRSTWCFEKQ